MITFTQISYINQYCERINILAEKKKTITAKWVMINNLAWKRLMN